VGGGCRGWLIYGRAAAGRWGWLGTGQAGRLGRAAAVPPPLGRACPCCAVGQAGGPCTTRAFGPCRHGHGGSRAVQPMGRAKRPCRGPCRRPMGCLEIYKNDTDNEKSIHRKRNHRIENTSILINTSNRKHRNHEWTYMQHVHNQMSDQQSNMNITAPYAHTITTYDSHY
jgi:hypothetical protein